MVASGLAFRCPAVGPASLPRYSWNSTSGHLVSSQPQWFLERKWERAVKGQEGDQKELILDEQGGRTQCLGSGQRQGPLQAQKSERAGKD